VTPEQRIAALRPSRYCPADRMAGFARGHFGRLPNELEQVPCRAVDVPTRIAAVYAPGLSPMDSHVVAETAINGNWYAWDATRSAPRTSGQAELTGMQITVGSPDDLPLDTHEELVVLG
jgi:hypothetical protein